MRTAYEKGYTVYTLKDCVATLSLEAQEGALHHNFGMFSFPTTSKEIMRAIKAPATTSSLYSQYMSTRGKME